MNILENVIKQLLFEARVTTQIKSFKMPKDFPVLESLWKKTGIKPLDFVPANQKRNDLTLQQIKDLAEPVWFRKYDGFRVEMKGVNTNLDMVEQRTELLSYLGSITGGTMYKEKMGPSYAVIVSVNQNARSGNQDKSLMFPKYEFLVFYADKTLPLKIPTAKIATLSSGADVYSYEDIMGITVPTEKKPVLDNMIDIAIPPITIDQLNRTTNSNTIMLNKLFLSWYLNSSNAKKYYADKGTSAIKVYDIIKSEATNSCELKKCISEFQRTYNLTATSEFDDATKNFILAQSNWIRTAEDGNKIVQLPLIDDKTSKRITRQIPDCDRDLSSIQQGMDVSDDAAVKQEPINVASITVPGNGYIAGEVTDDPSFYDIQKLMLQVLEKMKATSRPVYINLKTALQNTANQGDYYKASTRKLGATQTAVSTLKSAMKRIYPNLVTDTNADTVEQWFVQVLTDYLAK